MRCLCFRSCYCHLQMKTGMDFVEIKLDGTRSDRETHQLNVCRMVAALQRISHFKSILNIIRNFHNQSANIGKSHHIRESNAMGTVTLQHLCWWYFPKIICDIVNCHAIGFANFVPFAIFQKSTEENEAKDAKLTYFKQNYTHKLSIYRKNRTNLHGLAFSHQNYVRHLLVND